MPPAPVPTSIKQQPITFDPATAPNSVVAGVAYCGMPAGYCAVFSVDDHAIITGCMDGMEYVAVTAGLSFSELFMIGCTLFRRISSNPRHVREGFDSTRTAFLRSVPGGSCKQQHGLIDAFAAWRSMSVVAKVSRYASTCLVKADRRLITRAETKSTRQEESAGRYNREPLQCGHTVWAKEGESHNHLLYGPTIQVSELL